MVGIALSLSGLQMQTLFRNPMAGPYVLGISSGASLGVAFVILGFSASFTPETVKSLGNWALVAASWVGAGAVMILMLFISVKVKDILIVLILGIMLSSGISAIVSIMQYFSNESMLKAYVIWTMGSLGNLSGSQLQILFLSLSAGIIISLLSSKMLNALLLGENYASSIGLNITFARIVIFTGTSILAGSVTAFCGPIGFIGIAAAPAVLNAANEVAVEMFLGGHIAFTAIPELIAGALDAHVPLRNPSLEDLITLDAATRRAVAASAHHHDVVS